MIATPFGFVVAAWVGAGPVRLSDGRVLRPGDQHVIPAGEAEESGNWAPLSPPTSKRGKAAPPDKE